MKNIDYYLLFLDTFIFGHFDTYFLGPN